MGRTPYPRDANGRIVRPGEPGYDDLRNRDADAGGGPDAGTDTNTDAGTDVGAGAATGARSLTEAGQKVARGVGGRFVSRSDRGTDNGADEKPKAPRVPRQKAAPVTEAPEPVTVEPHAPKAARTGPASSTRKTSLKGSFKAEQVTRVVEAGFGMLAMTFNRRHWAVQDRKVEVDPWAPAAAELLNKYIPDIETAEKFGDGMAALSVIMGLGGMIAVRYQTDRDIERRRREAILEARREEMIEQEHRIDPDAPATAPPVTSNGHRPGTGAAPTQPGKISGLGGSGGAF